MNQDSQTPWTTQDAVDYYNLDRWGKNHFSISEKGTLCIHPLADSSKVDLMEVIKEAQELGLKPPLTIRVQDMLRNRVAQLNEAFKNAIDDEGYTGRYRGVFPIKVNQLREVVEEILDAGSEYQLGLEAGSKPELLIALAMLKKQSSLLICNGYKDEDYIRLALMGRKLGKEVIIVIEQLSEVDEILKVAAETNVQPLIGIRVKLQTQGEGKWATSSGDNAKFGLSSMEVIAACEKIQQAGLADSLQLIHFHIGSQVPNIHTIKKAVTEAARFYCEVHKLGFSMRYLDVGGGLGIDYDGSRSNFESSMNYSMEVYARDVVFNIKSVCKQSNVPCPDIISESGRAIVAPHSILILEVVDSISKGTPEGSTFSNSEAAHPVIDDLNHILNAGDRYGSLERFHDAQEKKDEIHSLFNLGYLDLKTRAYGESIFWEICRDIHNRCSSAGYIPDELAELSSLLSEQYVCNFSVFQSLLDHWALKQLFPIVPLHRLNEKPTVSATLVDITCDSDGKVSEFIDLEDVRHSLQLHTHTPSEPYYLGAFMVGAYQDIMGDLHNLFGRVNEVHVFLEDDEDDGFYIEETINGFSTEEVLDFIQYKGSDLCRMMKKQIELATREDRVKPREGVRLLKHYMQLIKDKTYLNKNYDS